MNNPIKSFIILLFSCFFMLSCKTYYQKNIDFNNHFQKGEFEKASKALDSDKKAENRKTKLLFFMNKGTIASLSGNYKESNDYFEKAYITIEDHISNPLNFAASTMINPNVVDYTGEEFEKLFIHYYKAINYLKLNKDKLLITLFLILINFHVSKHLQKTKLN